MHSELLSLFSKYNGIKKSAVIIGFGMGGFFDGILFHQILQIHNMLSNKLFPDTLVKMEINMFWDGIFHAFAWLTTLIGILLLWKTSSQINGKRPNKLFIGSLLLGWGLFNLIEGLLDHEIFQLHHVVQRASFSIQLFWDVVFLISGLILIFIGKKLIRSNMKQF